MKHTAKLDGPQIAIVKRGLREALELIDMIERSNRVCCRGDPQFGRIVERGVDLTDSLKRGKRDYKRLLEHLK